MEILLPAQLEVSQFMQNLGEWLRPIMAFFSFLGTEQFFLVMVPLLYWCVDARLGMRIAIMLILTNSIKGSLKLVFHGPRPYWVDPHVQAMAAESSFGLPSGHAMDAASLWGLLAAIVRKRWLTIIALIIILMIGLSRIYLGVHFAFDVLSGWLVGLILVLLFLLLEKPVVAWFRKSAFGVQLLFAALVCTLVILLGLGSRQALSGWTLPQEWVDNAAMQWPDRPINPLDLEGFITIGGLALGLIAGLALLFKIGSEARADGDIILRFGRYLLGMAGLLALYVGLGQIFPDEPLVVGYIFRVLRYTLMGIWVAFGAPWLFIRLKLAQKA